jgi:rubrerythrin
MATRNGGRSDSDAAGRDGGAADEGGGPDEGDLLTAAEVLSALARLDAEAASAYLAAAEAVEEADVREALEGFARDHLRHVKELAAALSGLGEEDVERKLEQRSLLLPALARIAASYDTHAVVLALLNDEQLTNLSYEDALGFDWDDPTEQLLAGNRADEQRHYDWLLAREEALEREEATGGQPEASP